MGCATLCSQTHSLLHCTKTVSYCIRQTPAQLEAPREYCTCHILCSVVWHTFSWSYQCSSCCFLCERALIASNGIFLQRPQEASSKNIHITEVMIWLSAQLKIIKAHSRCSDIVFFPPSSLIKWYQCTGQSLLMHLANQASISYKLACNILPLHVLHVKYQEADKASD